MNYAKIKKIGCRVLGVLTALLILWSAVPKTGAEAQIVYRYASKDGHPRIALTFDDGPHPAYTPQILDVLKEFGVCATFFAVGSNIENYPSIVKRIQEEGHEIGNHTFNHCHVAKMSRDELKKDIISCMEIIESTVGESPRFFRPPEGVCNQDVKVICEELGLIIVLWSVDTKDWAHTPKNQIIDNVRHNTHNGSIILMHDFIGKNSPTPEALRSIIPMLRELGYEFVTVSQLLAEG